MVAVEEQTSLLGEMKMKPSEETVAYLKPTLEWLEAGAPHKVAGKYVFFNMDVFESEPIDLAHLGYERGPTTNGCGTACCIAGATALFNGFTDIFGSCGGDAITSCLRLGERIGMDADDAEILFFVGAGTSYGLEDVTPLMAAMVLRRYIDTGEVDWPAEVIE